MSSQNPNPKSAVPAPTPKRRGRPRGAAPVTLTVTINGDPSMKGRVDNLIDDLPQSPMKVESDGLNYRIKFATGPEARMAKKGIASALGRLKMKGRIIGAVIATNVVTV